MVGEIITADGERTFWMSALEVLEYGMVDQILTKNKYTVDIDMDEVALFDPAFSPIPLSVSITHLLDAWADSDCHCGMISK